MRLTLPIQWVTPRLMLALSALLAASLVWLTLRLATQAPWLGVTLVADTTTVRIAQVDADECRAAQIGREQKPVQGGATFVGIIFITVWLGVPPPVSQGYAFGVVTAMYLGVAVGITRYRLFDLERWWFNVWLWLFAGAAVIATDLVLVYTLQWARIQALGLALALVGWIYFPARQWLIDKLLPEKKRRLESLFPQLLRIGLASGHTDNLAHAWRQLVQETFAPLHITGLDQHITVAQVSQDGLALDLPNVGCCPSSMWSVRRSREDRKWPPPAAH